MYMSFTRLTRILRLSGGFFFFSPRQCVAPIALMDEPPLVYTVLICDVIVVLFVTHTAWCEDND